MSTFKRAPYAFIAIEPTRRLALELGVEVEWRPLTLDIPSYLGYDLRSR